MKVVIIEDETAAARNLQSLLEEVFPDISIMDVIESVDEAVEWFRNDNRPDIVFMDIHLADGNAFLIFEKATVNAPIIFTTAYDQYALEAFKVNSIDYLLKPIKPSDLKRSVDKLEKLSSADISFQQDRIAETSKQYTGFLLHFKDRLVPLDSGQIAFCYTFDERVTIYTLDGRRIPYDKSLDTLIEQLPPVDFYRINRQFIIARTAVNEIAVWPGSRLSVSLTLSTPEKIIVSKARTPDFKRWIIKH